MSPSPPPVLLGSSGADSSGASSVGSSASSTLTAAAASALSSSLHDAAGGANGGGGGSGGFMPQPATDSPNMKPKYTPFSSISMGGLDSLSAPFSHSSGSGGLGGGVGGAFSFSFAGGASKPPEKSMVRLWEFQRYYPVVGWSATMLPTDKGGWSAFFTNLTWTNNFDPAAHLGLRGTPAAAWFGWPTMPRMEALRSEWFEAPDLAEQKRICAEIKRQFWTDVPYLPLGCPSAAPTCPPPTALP